MNRKKILIKISVSFISILFTLLVCEFLLALFYPQPLGPVRGQFNKKLGYNYIPNQKGKQSAPGYYEYRFEHTNSGFRKTAHLPNQFARKIMLLGDSFTYGLGVDTEDTFAYLLQDSILNQEIEIINAGHEGRGTDHALKVLQIIGSEPDIELVVYVAFHNDFGDNLKQEFYELQNDTLISKELYPEEWSFFSTSLYSWVREYSHVYSAFRKVVFLLTYEKDEYESVDEAFEETPLRQTAFQLTEIYLRKIAEWCHAEDKIFAVYQIPSIPEMVYQADTGLPSPFIEFFRMQTAKLDIPYYEFTPNLTSDFEQYYLKEGHWNKHGHQVAADRLIKDIIVDNRFNLLDVER